MEYIDLSRELGRARRALEDSIAATMGTGTKDPGMCTDDDRPCRDDARHGSARLSSRLPELNGAPLTNMSPYHEG